MVFSSLTFLLLFVPIFFAVYFLVPRRLKNGVLFLFSLLFYSWGEPIYVLLMLFSTLLDYSCGLVIEKNRGNRKAKIALTVSVLVNVGLLSVFKYGDFLITNVNLVTGLNLPLPRLLLPIGISFYTFQTMSYSIDVYRGDTRAQRNFISFGAYVALFPQLIAGPIVRYRTIAEEIDDRETNFETFGAGVKRFVGGLGKKVLLANNLGLIWKAIADTPPNELTVVGTWLGVVAFGLQLYFDFSGYSDMAVGLGKALGFHFPENFNYPYIAQSVTEFWRRWHMSLGQWFRDYVYIPLGGNKKGIRRQLINIAIVWLLTGLWHGAAWNFILWGAYYGLILIIEKLFLLKYLKKAPPLIARLYTLFVVVIGWALFAADSVSECGAILNAMFGGVRFCDNNALYLLTTSLPLIIIAVVASTPLIKRLYDAITARLKVGSATLTDCLGIALITGLCFAYLIDGSYNPFLYFRF